MSQSNDRKNKCKHDTFSSIEDDDKEDGIV